MKSPRHAFLIRIAGPKSTRSQLVDKDVVSFGRSDAADVLALSQSVSRVHMIATLRDGDVWLEDQGSANGTFLDDLALEPRAPTLAKPGAKIRLGECEETFAIEIVDIPAELADLETQRSIMKAAAHEAVQDATRQAQAVVEAERDGLLAAALTQAQSEADAFKMRADDAYAERVSAAEAAAAKLEADARNAVASVKIDAQKEAEAILADARAKARAEIEAAQDESARSAKAAQREAAKIAADAAADAEKARLEAVARAAELVARQTAKTEEAIAAAAAKAKRAADEKSVAIVAAAESKVAALLAEAQRARENVEQNAKTAIADAQAKANGVALAAEAKAATKLREAELRARVIDEGAAARAADVAARMQESEARLRDAQQAADRAAAAVESARRQADEQTRTAQARAALALAEAEKVEAAANERAQRAIAARDSALQNLAAAQEQAGALEARIQEQIGRAKADLSRLEADAQRLNEERAEAERSLASTQERLRLAESQREQSQREAQAVRERALLEANEIKQGLDTMIVGEKLKAIDETRARMLEEERQVQALRRHQTAEMINQMDVLLIPAIQSQFPTAEAAFYDRLRASVRETARRVMLADNSTIANEIERVSTFEPAVEAAWRAKRRRRAIWGGAGATAVLALAIFGRDLSGLASGLMPDSASRSAASVAADQVIAEKRRKEKFEPPQIDAYQTTYANNVLYMRGYVETKLDPEFQKRWILGLNLLFVNQLKLSENSIVDFSAQETSLVRALQALKEKADARSAPETIAKMQALEDAERGRLASILKGDAAYAKFRAFEQQELAAFQSARKPGSN